MKPRDLPEQANILCQPEQQLLYASVLGRCTWAGTLMLLVSFVAEAVGLLPPHVAHERLPGLWGLPVQRYLLLADWPIGWKWLPLAGQGDLASMLGIAMLCACSGVCVLAVLPHYVRRHDHAYVGLCLAEVAVLLVAASGVLVQGR